MFVVTSSVRGEVCGRHQKHAPLSVVRLIVEFLFLSIPPLHHTRAVTSTFSHPCSKFLATANVGLAHYDSFSGGGGGGGGGGGVIIIIIMSVFLEHFSM